MSVSQNRLEEVDGPVSDAENLIDLGDAVVEASSPFIGEWRTLVSTTNWEKGRIICHWRSSLESAGGPVTEYSDEAWAQLVGGVTAQHVGRLRRTYQRFGEVFPEYSGLYWSHFLAAGEWDDAEMWLEGALQNGWSVSQMRAQRWETVGDAQPAESDAANRGPSSAGSEGSGSEERIEQIEGGESPAGGQPSDASASSAEVADPASEEEPRLEGPAAPTAERSAPSPRPLADIPELPEDLAEAFEQFKLAILNHKLTGWGEVSCEDVLVALDSLKLLAEAPSE